MMPLRRAMRWFSEICGVCLGLGLALCWARISILEERVDGMQKTLRRPMVQANHQEVIIESDALKLAREILQKELEHGNMPGTQ